MHACMLTSRYIAVMNNVNSRVSYISFFLFIMYFNLFMRLKFDVYVITFLFLLKSTAKTAEILLKFNGLNLIIECCLQKTYLGTKTIVQVLNNILKHFFYFRLISIYTIKSRHPYDLLYYKSD